MIKSINKNKGFTIVELLVVIVVIGILAAITIVSYTGIQDKARATQAKTVSYSMRDAAEQYFTDKGNYPYTLAELNTFATFPTGVSSSPGVATSTALTAASNKSGDVKIKYTPCGASAPTVTGATNTGYMIRYFDGTEQSISGGTGTVCTANSI